MNFRNLPILLISRSHHSMSDWSWNRWHGRQAQRSAWSPSDLFLLWVFLLTGLHRSSGCRVSCRSWVWSQCSCSQRNGEVSFCVALNLLLQIWSSSVEIKGGEHLSFFLNLCLSSCCTHIPKVFSNTELTKWLHVLLEKWQISNKWLVFWVT